MPSRRPRPHQTKEARRVESAGFLRGYSRAAFGRFAIVRDIIRRRLRNAWRAAPPFDLESIADKQKPDQAPHLVCPLCFQRGQCPARWCFDQHPPLSRQVSRAYPETGQGGRSRLWLPCRVARSGGRFPRWSILSNVQRIRQAVGPGSVVGAGRPGLVMAFSAG